MIAFFANLFGYVLNFLYGFVGNYGIAIILFSVLVKVIMIPISISQQRTMKKSQKINDEMKQIQYKYKNDPEKMNKEVMDLYKREKMSPFSGCFSAIIQIILLFSVFYLVRSPLTYMKKIDKQIIENSIAVVQDLGGTSNYKEIAVINYINKLKSTDSVSEEEKTKTEEITEPDNQTENKEENTVESIQEDTNEDTNKKEFDISEYKDKLYINMNLFGIDLSKVPTEDLRNIKAHIIPILYVISSFISIRLSTNMTNKKKNNEKLISDGSEKEQGEEKKTQDLKEAMEDTNKKMAWFMPIMSISIAMVAPLGLALYWLMNNILMIFERLVLNKIIKE